MKTQFAELGVETTERYFEQQAFGCKPRVFSWQPRQQQMGFRPLDRLMQLTTQQLLLELTPGK